MSLPDKLSNSLVQCGLCGYTFSTADACNSTCTSCLLPCDLIRCPNCGYSFPRQETTLGRFLKKIKQKFVKEPVGD